MISGEFPVLWIFLHGETWPSGAVIRANLGKGLRGTVRCMDRIVGGFCFEVGIGKYSGVNHNMFS